MKVHLISFPVASEGYRGHGSAVFLPRLIVGTRHCRVLALGNINSDARGVDIKGKTLTVNSQLLTVNSQQLTIN
ncbi:hypothetical protein [Microcoleus sp. S13_C5]|uniref:hypothetical protein n=1 Tax=Microcoleus sp. S13_C5 TaxID=3055411 RepID=UPI002FD3D400